MASLMELLGFSKPVAYSRITRTPIYTSTSMPEGQDGSYANNSMTVRPEALQTSPFVVAHESAHQIYEQAGLRKAADQLSPQVGERPRNGILASPLYKAMPGYGSPEMLSDEGLAYSIGDSDEQPYVQKAATAIEDPRLRAQLLRLHQNAVASRRLGGIGALQPSPPPGSMRATRLTERK